MYCTLYLYHIRMVILIGQFLLSSQHGYSILSLSLQVQCYMYREIFSANAVYSPN